MTLDLAREFPLDPELSYLNHAAIGVWPRRAADAVKAFAEENATLGAANWLAWFEIEKRIRQRFADLVNASSANDIALLKNTSEALSVVARGLPWRSGDNVVLAAQEFPSNRMPWQSLGEFGVEARVVDIASEPDPEAALIAATDARTRVLTTSSVHYGDGLRMDLARLGEHCRANGIRFCVDAIQSLGALPLDARACQADYVMADGHKWLLGPEAVTVFYTRPEIRDELRLNQFGWRMVEHPFEMEGDVNAPSSSARRFEAGSVNTLGIVAQEASLSLLQEVGIEQAAGKVLAHRDYLADGLGAIPGVELVSRNEPERRSGIVTFRVRGADTAALSRHLFHHRVICARRGGGIRLAPHFYTPRPALDRALEVIGDFAG